MNELKNLLAAITVADPTGELVKETVKEVAQEIVDEIPDASLSTVRMLCNSIIECIDTRTA